MNIKLEKFEGPLSLLLKLIEKEKMDVTKISLAKISEDFIGYIKSKEINIEEIADFLVVASKLLLIKTRALLPCCNLEEDEDIEEFEQQLKIYQKYLEASLKLEEIINHNNFLFTINFERKKNIERQRFSPPPKLNQAIMHDVFAGVLAKIILPKRLDERKLEKKINIEEKISRIVEMLNKNLELNFSKILQNTQSKTEIIVSFLAILELEKQKNLVIQQSELFEEIIITKY